MASLTNTSESVSGKSQSVTIRISKTDVEAARRIAREKGLPYQTYIKMLLHQSLERERRQEAWRDYSDSA